MLAAQEHIDQTSGSDELVIEGVMFLGMLKSFHSSWKHRLVCGLFVPAACLDHPTTGPPRAPPPADQVHPSARKRQHPVVQLS